MMGLPRLNSWRPEHGPMQVDNLDARIVAHDRHAPREMELEARLQAALRANGEGDDLVVRVTPGCGEVKVRVCGPKATLTLSFDRAEARSALVSSAVRTGVERYRSALGHKRRRES